MMSLGSVLSGTAASGPLSAEPVGAARAPGREADPAEAGATDVALGFAELLAAALGIAPDPVDPEHAPAADGGASDGGDEGAEGEATGPGGAGMEAASGGAMAAQAQGFAGVSGAANGARRAPDAVGGAAVESGEVGVGARRGDAAVRGGGVARPGDAAEPGDVGVTGPSGMADEAGSPDARGEAVDHRAATRAGSRGAGATAAGSPHATDAAVSVVDRSMEHLDPELRRRLGRVIERMRDEFGHEVRLVEGYRDQRRQDQLYAQGRSRPGPVVTWARTSAHTAGRAADLIVDGTFDNPTAYARLGRIAREEGLATIGPRDAGHVELPASDAAGAGAAARGGAGGAGSAGAGGGMAAERRDVGLAAAVTPGDVPRAARVPPVARVARPADVAQVAQVARVATVARVAGPVAMAGRGGAAAGSRASTAGGGDVAERGSGLPGRNGGATVESGSAPAVDLVSGAGFSVAAASPDGAIAVPGEVRSVGVADRVARILELRDGADARPLSQVLLRLDDLDIGDGRVRVGVRGSAVDARIDLDDPVLAGRLGARIDDLSRALRRQGLDPETLLVQASRASDAVESTRLAVAGADAEPAWVRALRSLDGGAGAQGDRRHDGGRDSRSGEPDVSQQRSRREHRREDRT